MEGHARTIFFGSGSFGLPVLDRLDDAGSVALVAVVTAPARPAGRSGEPRPTPVAQAASERGIPILMPSRLRDPVDLAALRATAPDVIVLADYGRLIPGAVLSLPPHGALNLHPSLLPRHRGASPVPAAILAGDALTGVTLMRMDEGLDTGPIVATAEYALRGDEVAPELEARLAELAAGLLMASLPGWLAGTLEPRPQPSRGATLTRPLRREDGRLDARRPAFELERQVRAYQPWPGSFLEVDGERLIVWAATVDPTEPGDVAGAPGRGKLPGALVPAADGVALLTGDGRLRLTEVQPAGGRRMSGTEFARGRRL